MKILVDYDPQNGEILFESGLSWGGPVSEIVTEYKESGDTDKLVKLVKLKNAGFTVDEIIELSRKELL